MKLPETQCWVANSGKTLAKAEELLATCFTLVEKETEDRHYTLVDDADWDLWHTNIILARFNDKQYRLIRGNNQLDTTCTHKTLRFWWDFPASELQQILKKTINLRALMPIAQLGFTRTEYNLLNQDLKTVARLETLILFDKERTPTSYFVSLCPLRGYIKAFKKAASLCESLSMQSAQKPEIRYLLESQGITPKNRSSKYFGIEPQQPTEDVARLMLAHMFDTARQHEYGIIDDIDTEFLHDYRVSLRKSRSLLTLLKQAFPQDWYLQVKSQLSSLAQVTNTLRDLDVFLLDRQHYSAMLPEQFSKGLELVFSHVHKQRERAQKQLVKNLQSNNYAVLCAETAALLAQPSAFITDLSGKPVGDEALKRILKRYHRIRRIGAEITPSTPDAQVHALRIECKKLRYLLDFFAELFDAKRVNVLIKSLKKLQTILGYFNDYSVQQLFLYQRLNDEKSSQAQAAIHGLIAVLHQRQLAERKKVEATFLTFGSNDVAQHFEQLQFN